MRLAAKKFGIFRVILILINVQSVIQMTEGTVCRIFCAFSDLNSEEKVCWSSIFWLNNYKLCKRYIPASLFGLISVHFCLNPLVERRDFMQNRHMKS